jgi:hypothetical protein
MAQQMSIQTEELRELRESSGKEGGGGRCTKCAQMQDELTRNLREKADDKQHIIKLEGDVRKLQGQLAKAEAATNDALAKYVECNFDSGAQSCSGDVDIILHPPPAILSSREKQQCVTEQDAKIADMHQNIQVKVTERRVASASVWVARLITCAADDLSVMHAPRFSGRP